MPDRPPLSHTVSVSSPSVMGYDRFVTRARRPGHPIGGARRSPSAVTGGRRPPCGYRRAVLRWLSALVVAAVLSAFAVLLLTGQYVNEGPVLVRLTRTHGVHVGDLFVVLGWAVALLAVGGLLRPTGRRDG